jgi:hypothetical protein
MHAGGGMIRTDYLAPPRTPNTIAGAPASAAPMSGAAPR